MLLQIVGRHFFPLVKIFLAFLYLLLPYTEHKDTREMRSLLYMSWHFNIRYYFCILGYKITVSRTNPNLFKNGVSQIYVWEFISIKYDLIRLTITREEKTINLFNVWVLFFCMSGHFLCVLYLQYEENIFGLV